LRVPKPPGRRSLDRARRVDVSSGLLEWKIGVDAQNDQFRSIAAGAFAAERPVRGSCRTANVQKLDARTV